MSTSTKTADQDLAYVKPIKLSEIVFDAIPVEMAADVLGTDENGQLLSKSAISRNIGTEDYFVDVFRSLSKHQPDTFYIIKRGVLDPKIKISSITIQYLIDLDILVTFPEGIRFHPTALEVLFGTELYNAINDSGWKPTKIATTTENSSKAAVIDQYAVAPQELPFHSLLKEHGLHGALKESAAFTEYFMRTLKLIEPNVYDALVIYNDSPRRDLFSPMLVERGILEHLNQDLPRNVSIYLQMGNDPSVDRFPQKSFVVPEMSSHPESIGHIQQVQAEVDEKEEIRHFDLLGKAIAIIKSVSDENFDLVSKILSEGKVGALPLSDIRKLHRLKLVVPNPDPEYLFGEEDLIFAPEMAEAVNLVLKEKTGSEELHEERTDSELFTDQNGSHNLDNAPAVIQQETTEVATKIRSSKSGIMAEEAPRRRVNKSGLKVGSAADLTDLAAYLSLLPIEQRRWKKDDLIKECLETVLKVFPGALEQDADGRLDSILSPSLYKDLTALGIIEGNSFTIIGRIAIQNLLEINLDDTNKFLESPRKLETLSPNNISVNSNYKGLLLEFCQANKSMLPVFRIDINSTIPHAPKLTCQASLDFGGKTFESSEIFGAANKKAAEQAASKELIQIIFLHYQDNAGNIS